MNLLSTTVKALVSFLTDTNTVRYCTVCANYRNEDGVRHWTRSDQNAIWICLKDVCVLMVLPEQSITYLGLCRARDFVRGLTEILWVMRAAR